MSGPIVFAVATLVAAAAFPPPALPAVSAHSAPEIVLREGRRSLREEGNDAPLRSVESLGGLWEARARLARAAAGGSCVLPAGRELGLDAVDDWLAIRNDPKGTVGTLTRFASSTACRPIALEALEEASRRVDSSVDRLRLREALTKVEAGRPPSTPRASIILLLARLRASEHAADRRGVLEALVRAVPDAPERDVSLFTAEEVRSFRQAAIQAPLAVRLERARAVVETRPDEAAELATGEASGSSSADRLAAAQLLLVTGHLRESARTLREVIATAGEPAVVSQSRALMAAVDLRRFSSAILAPPTRTARRRGRSSTRRPARPVAVRLPNLPELERLQGEAEALLAEPLAPRARQRLLTELLRASSAAGRLEAAGAAARRLAELDPDTTVGAEELFRAAFSEYRAGGREGLATARRSFSELASTYRSVPIRRRAIYWEARTLEKAGDPAARELFASLLSGTSADIYAIWAAERLGVQLASVPPLAAGEDAPPSGISGPDMPSREYLAAGLDDLAELAAEEEGSLDQPFAASIASERQEYRKAASLLKGYHPALGTPEEGAVPLEARTLFYPLAHYRVLKDEAEREGISVSLLCGLIRQESLFQPSVVSRSGAVGLMQVMPSTGRLLHRREGGHGRVNLASPGENVRLGGRFVGKLLALFDGDVVAALAAYNAGPARVVRWRRENPDLAPDEWVEAMPFHETRDYVKRVLFFSGAYAALYGFTDPPAIRRAGRDDVLRPAAAPSGSSSPPSDGR